MKRITTHVLVFLCMMLTVMSLCAAGTKDASPAKAALPASALEKEAPDLGAQVKAGTLPGLEERLPDRKSTRLNSSH